MPLRLEEIADAKDEEYYELKSIIMNGFPERKSALPDGMQKFWGVRHYFAIDDNLIVHIWASIIHPVSAPTINVGKIARGTLGNPSHHGSS